VARKVTVDLLIPLRQSRYSASSVSRAWIVCWCDTFFRVFLCSLLVLLLPSESLFFVAATAPGACFLLGRFFVEALVIGVKTGWCKNVGAAVWFSEIEILKFD